MDKKITLKCSLLLSFFFLFAFSVSGQTIRYVKEVPSGAADGSSWANASGDLQAMLNASSATAGDMVWVASGTYKPVRRANATGTITLNDRNNAFVLRNNVKVYGGFAGTETAVSQRDLINNISILSGDLGVTGATADNAYHVVISSAYVAAAELNGFTISDGYAFGTNSIQVNGYTIDNRVGGGIFTVDSSPILTNLRVVSNRASDHGGGLYIYFSSPPMSFITVSGNDAGSGAGIYGYGSSVVVSNGLITGNGSAATGAGGIYTNSSSLQLNLSNVTISGNYGYGTYNFTTTSPVNIRNSIIYGNQNGAYSGGTQNIYNSLVQNLTSTANSNISGLTEPQFVNAPLYINAPFTGGDYRLGACSPAINAGNNSFASAGTLTDVVGNPRIYSSVVDMGAVEWQGEVFLPSVRYVKPVASGTGDGSSWANASSDLQAMINATCVEQVWVAAGTYKPMRKADFTGVITLNDRNNAFVLRNNVKIYGGFTGTETALSQRNWITNVTTLSGDLGTTGIATDNAYHVVVSAGTSGLSELNGFTVTDGYANGGNYITVNGQSTNQNYGGGINIIASSPVLTNLIVTGNYTSALGGGLYIGGTAAPSLSYVTITNNNGVNGAALYNSASSSAISNALITGNYSSSGYGGIYTSSSASSLILTNVTMSGNSGYGVYSSSSSANINIRNSIIHGNQYGITGGVQSIANSLVQDLTDTLNGNINGLTEPQFIDAPLYTTAPFTGGDYRLGACSPAINAGNNSYLPAGAATDVAGNTRIYSSVVDMGATEWQGEVFLPSIRYVKPIASGTGDGSSWANASNDLQAMINTTCVTQVWVAAGTYKPMRKADFMGVISINDRNNAFVLRNNVKIYGGFSGTETALSQRNWVTNVTTLSGDLGTTGIATDNAYHVVVSVGTSGLSELNGFTITDGYANGGNYINVNGQSVNQNYGGGINIVGSSPILTNLIVTGNFTSSQGGGLYAGSFSSPSLSYVTFTNNNGVNGAAFYNSASSTTISNALITGNYSSSGYGGIYLAFSSSSLSLTNATISGNSGYGIYSSSSSANINIRNSVIYGNQYGITGGIRLVVNSLVQDLIGTTNGNIDGFTEPQFVDAPLYIYAPFTGGDYRLGHCSPAINTGNNSYLPTGATTDVVGNSRIYSSTVDMGAVEWQGEVFLPSVRYVKPIASGTGDGSSWANASSDLQAMINATCVEQVWVAAGTYKPMRKADFTGVITLNDRNNAFVLRNNVKVYGGFSGTETALEQRNFTTNVTTLSGDLGTAGFNTDNAYHVVVSAGFVGTAELNGFTVTDGYANGGNYITVNTQTPSQNYGGGIYVIASSPILTNLVVTGNYTSALGGGLYVSSYSSPSLSYITISNNNGVNGAALYNNASAITISNAFITGNYSTSGYGGIYTSLSSSTVSLTNVTLSGNTGYSIYSSSSSAAISVRNSIIYGNQYGVTGGIQSIANSLVQGNTSTLNGNINGIYEPQFVNAPLYTTAPFTGGDYRLGACSPAINTGNNSYLPTGALTDAVGNARIYNSMVDMGAVEWQGEVFLSAVRYVKPVASGTGDGSSWDNASNDLQAMINATCVEQVWVAAGTYKPIRRIDFTPAITLNDRNNAFVLRNNVKVYGGFAGTETSVNQRNWVTNVTTLSGDIGTTGFSTDNACHVVVSAGAVGLAELNGFTIADANANGGSILLVNMESVNASFGGGIYVVNSSPILTNLTVRNNTASIYGGGLYVANVSSPVISAVNISGNSAPSGGAVYNYNAALNISNSLITGNASGSSYGGIYTSLSGSSLNLTNVTMSGNQGYALYTSSSSSPVNLRNTIIYRNGLGITGGLQYIYNSFIQGLTATTNGNVSSLNDISFVNAPSYVTAPFTNGDYSLSHCSPAINSGNNTYLPFGTVTDIKGNARIYESVVDMGAIEWQGEVTLPSVRYVKETASGTGDGTSWANASNDLQAMMDASCVEQVWVAAGTYKPMRAADALDAISLNNRRNAFVLHKDVKVYGGFSGTETALEQRNFTTNVAILHGDIGTFTLTTDNAYHVVISAGDVGTAELNGFTIRNGFANGTSSITVNGQNVIDNGGGDVYVVASSPILNNLYIFNGSALNYGGGMYVASGSSPLLLNSKVNMCSAGTYGGAIYNSASTTNVVNSLIYSTISSQYGGIYVTSSSSAVTLTNVTMSGLSGYAVYSSSSAATIAIRNSIIYGNQYGVSGGTVSMFNSLVQSSTSTSNGNISGATNPQFVNAPAYTSPFSEADYTVLSTSPVIDRGNNAYLPANIALDLGGNNRIANSIVDMGAYEYLSGCTTTAPVASAQSFCGNGTVAGLVATGTNIKWYDVSTGGSALATTTSLISGTYYATQTANGCESPRTAVTVTINTVPATPTVSITQPTCAVTTGAISVTSPTGTGITYSINGTTYQASATFAGLSAGTYSVTTKNAAGCISTATSVTINTAPAAPTTPVTSVTQPTCMVATGTITITSPAGSGITYSIDGTTYQSSTVFATLPSGTYNVRAQNALGCTSAITSVTINAAPAVPSAPVASVTQPTCLVATGTISITLPTGTGITYSINGTNYQASATFAGLSAGTYSVTAKNAAGCISTATSVTINAAPVVPTAPVASSQSFCGNATVAGLVATGTNISWYNVATGGTALTPATILVSGTYYATQTVGTCESPRTSVAVIIQPACPSAAGILYVRKGYTGNGSSWANALGEVADALKAAKEMNTAMPSTVTQIWVAAGTYKPMYRADTMSAANPADRNNAFVLVNGVKVYGSFAGNETSLSQRVLPQFNESVQYSSVLSGDFNGDDTYNSTGQPGTNYTENAYHVVRASNITSASQTEVNGFTIKGGNANFGENDKNGGGIFNENTAVQYTNLLITANNAVVGAGNENIGSASSNSFTNVVFAKNTAVGTGGGGGASANHSGIACVYENCIIIDNSGETAGGIGNVSGTIFINRCIFKNNIATGNTSNEGGGAIANLYDGISTISNSKFISNSSTYGGAILNANVYRQNTCSNTLFINNTATYGAANCNINNQQGYLINATIYGNSGTSGTALYIDNSSSVTTANSIFYGNVGGNTIYNAGTSRISNSIIQGSGGSSAWNTAFGINGGNNLDVNPLFVNTISDFSLQRQSPAVNAGSNTYYQAGATPDLSAITTDLANNPRFYNGGVVDMGAYEYQGEPCNVAAPVASAQNFCGSATVAGLVATGTNIKWYNVTGGGTALSSTSALTTGTYYATQTVNGCESPRIAVTVTINTVPATPTVSITQPTCAVATGTITVATGTGLTYSIDGINYQTSGTFANLSAGTYSVTAKNALGCTSAITSVTINAAPAVPSAPTVTTVQPTCAVATGTITVATSAGLTYSINGANYQTSGTFANLAAGTYSIMAKNAAGCTSIATSVTINAAPAAPAAPTVTAVQPTCAVASGSITVATGTGLTYSIDGINYQASATFAGLSAGTYSVTAKNAAGCISTATSVTINAAPAVPSAPTVTTVQPTCAVATGSITVATSTGLTYSIDGINYQTSGTFTGLAAGTYSVTAKNAAGCISAATSVTINVAPAVPSAPTVTTVQPTCAVASGSITVATSVGLTYSIDGINYQASATFAGLSAGTYSVTAKNAAGCISTATSVTINAAPAVPSAPTVTTVQPTCAVATGTITVATGTGLTYSINGANYQTSGTFANLAAGTYSVTAKNAAGCISTATSVTINAAPAVPSAPTFTTVQPTCAVASGSITVATSTGLTYSINGTNYQTSGTFANLSAGTYSVTAKNAAGCISTATAVTINAAPATPGAPVATTIQPTCAVATGSITVATSAGLTYSIDGVNYQASATFTGLTAGTYSVMAKNAVGCISTATSVTINAAPVVPSAPTVTTVQPTCAVATGTITVATSAGLTYSIDGANYQASATFAGLSAGTYSVTAKSAAGCISTATSVTINAAPAAPTAPTVTTVQPTCAVATGSITVATSAGLTYSIDGINYQASGTFANLSAGTYSVTAKNAAGCISSATSVTINAAPAVPSAPVATTVQPTCAVATGTITIATSVGLTYSIDGTNYQTSGTFANLAAGTYSVTAKNAAGCTSSATSVTINAAPVVPTAPVASVVQPTCAVATGSITVATGTGLTYSIDGANYQTSATFANLVAGTYLVTAKNAAGCTSTATSVTINAAPAAPTAPTVTTVQPTCAVATGSITVATGTGLTYSINGTNYQTSGTFTGLAAGTYSVTAKNAAGCISTATSVTINAAPAVPSAPVVTVAQPTCAVTTGTISITAPVGTGITYSIDGANYQTSATFAGLSAGTYSVTAKNAAGCISTATSVTINAAPAVPSAPTVTTVQPTCAVATGSITVATSAGMTYSIDGTNYQTSATFSGLSAGTYSVTAKNAAGCISSATSVTINAAPAVPSAPVATTVQPTCAVATGTISITSPTGTGITYSINGTNYQTSATFSGLSAGTYSVTAKNAAGCISSATSVTINAAPAVPSTPTVTTVQPTCAVATGSITVATSAGLTYSIDGTNYQTSAMFAGLSTGTYSVTAKNAAGCISAATSVTINAAPTVPTAPTVTTVQPTCAVATGTITVATGTGLTYSIDGTNYQASGTFAGLSTGTYSVTAKNATGCTSTATSVTINAAPAVPTAPMVTVAQPVCGSLTGVITMSQSEGDNLEYSIDEGSFQSTPIFTNVLPGIHAITIKNISGCTRIILVQVNEPILAPSAPIALAQSLCNGATVGQLTATGANLQWYIDATGGSALASTMVLTTGSYYVSQTANGCTSSRTQVAVTINSAPVLVSPMNIQVCNSYVLPALATGAYYSTSGGTGTPMPAGTVLTTSQAVYVYASNSCGTDEESFFVTIIPTPVIASVSDVVACQSYTLPALSVGNYYTASGGQGTQLHAGDIITQSRMLYIFASTGVAVQCTAERSFMVTIQSTSPASAVAQTFCGSATVAELIASGADLQWYADATGGEALASTTALATGTYYVSQTINGCESTRIAVSVTVNATSVPTAVAQTFCGSATVAELIASGADLQWYADATGGEALASTATLATGTYYVSQTVNGCESTRVAVSVTVNATSVPTAVAQTFCGSATVAALTATGADLQWYADATGGEALASTTALATGTYYVSQTIDGCESTRVAVSVTVNATSVPTAVAQTFCGSATVAELIASGADLQWYADATGGEALASTATLATGTYYVSQTVNGCESTRIAVSVTVNATSVPTAVAQTFCGSATVAALTATGADLQWYADATGGEALASTTALATGTYYVSQTINGCESTRVAVSVTVNATSVPTAVAQTFCGSATVAELNATGADLQWYADATGGEALASTTALATGTYYVSQTINGCESARIAVSVTVNITSAPTGEATQVVTVDVAPDATIEDLVIEGSDIQWYASPEDIIAGTPLAAGTQLVNGTTYYATQTVNGCESAYLAVTVEVVLKTDGKDSIKFSYYPNPVKDRLHIISGSIIDRVEVYTLHGQRVINQTWNTTVGDLNMVQLEEATYLVRVYAGNYTESFKVVKGH